MSGKKKKRRPQIQFRELDSATTEALAEEFLVEIIDEWKTLGKRFILDGDLDDRSIQQFKFYSKEIITKFPKIKDRYLLDMYDEAVFEYVGLKYKIRTDKVAQERLGFNPLIFDGESVYLFPLNDEE